MVVKCKNVVLPWLLEERGTDRNGAPGRIEPLAYWFVVSCSTQREIPIESGSPRLPLFYGYDPYQWAGL